MRAWKILTALVIVGALVAADVFVAAARSDIKPARQIDAIAVGHGYSISIDAPAVHPVFAGHESSVAIYGGRSREGRPLARVGVPMNMEGRVSIGVLVPRDRASAEVVLADRLTATRIDLATGTRRSQGLWPDPSLLPLGIVAGETAPVSFIPCPVWLRLSAAERAAIVRPREALEGFCGAATA